MKQPPKWSLIIGVPSAIMCIVAVLSSAAAWPGIPGRVMRLEDASIAQNRKLEILQSDVTIIRRDAESSAMRSQESFRDMSSGIAKITGILQDVRDQVRDTSSTALQAKEKASNAAVIADDANREITRIRAGIEAEKKRQ